MATRSRLSQETQPADPASSTQTATKNYVDVTNKAIVGLIKRNNADAVTSATALMFETLTITGMKTTHWYKAVWQFVCNATGTVNPPNSTANIHLSAVGAAVTVSDPIIRQVSIINQGATNPGVILEMPFNVPSDGTYALGCSANSGGGSTTLNIIASGAASNVNAAKARCFWVEDMGLQ